MDGHDMNRRSIVLMGIVLAAAMARLLPHPPNVTPIAAMALFGGACLVDRRTAYLLPLAAMLLNDLVLGVTHYGFGKLLSIQPIVYACILATTAIGRLIGDRRSVWQVGTATLAGSVLFYVVTNLGVWATMNLYPLTASGLVRCYVEAIPFFRNTLAGDAVFTAVLFGGLAWLETRVAWMREKAPTLAA
jgi:hypothetical protein